MVDEEEEDEDEDDPEACVPEPPDPPAAPLPEPPPPSGALEPEGLGVKETSVVSEELAAAESASGVSLPPPKRADAAQMINASAMTAAPMASARRRQ